MVTSLCDAVALKKAGYPMARKSPASLRFAGEIGTFGVCVCVCVWLEEEEEMNVTTSPYFSLVKFSFFFSLISFFITVLGFIKCYT